MRVIVLEDFANDTGGLRVAPVRKQAFLVHRVEDAAMNGLQTVAHVRQGTTNDDRHRIREERTAYFVFDIYGC